MFLKKIDKATLESSKKLRENIEFLKATEFMCLNKVDTEGKKYALDIFGDNDVYAHRRIDLNYFPCQPIQLTAQNRYLQKTKCIIDLKSRRAIKAKEREAKEAKEDVIGVGKMGI